MKIVFLEPASPAIHVYKKMALPRTGPLYLGTILKNAGHDVRVYSEDIKVPEIGVFRDADVVALSPVTATAPRAYEYGTWLRKMGVKVLIGGPHVSFMPEEALEYADIVAIGEGENMILPLIEALEGKRDLSTVPGIAYLVDGKMHKTEPVKPVMDLDELPTIDFSLLQGGLQKGFISTIVPVMTSRGCPFNCSFCAVTKMFGHKYRFRSPGKVLEDLRAMPGDTTKHVFFYDDHFTAHRERTREIMERIIKEGLRFTSSAQVRTELGKDAGLLKLMRKAGIETLYVGLESVNPETLKSYNKGQTVEEIRDALASFHRAGMRVHGMFVFGSDNDTVDTIRETVHFAKKNKIESLQFMVLTPLPGTEFYYQLEKEGRLATKYWALFDGHHVTYEPKRITPYELQTETFRAMRDFYSLWDCTKPIMKFNFLDAMVRFYARGMVKSWVKSNRHYLDDFRASWRNALSRIEQDWRNRLVALRSTISTMPSLPPA